MRAHATLQPAARESASPGKCDLLSEGSFYERSSASLEKSSFVLFGVLQLVY